MAKDRREIIWSLTAGRYMLCDRRRGTCEELVAVGDLAKDAGAYFAHFGVDEPTPETAVKPCVVCGRGPHEYMSFTTAPPHTYSPSNRGTK